MTAAVVSAPNIRAASAAEPVLRVEGLSIDFVGRDATLRAVSNVNFSLRAGKTFALVGESGSGKSVTALALMRLLPRPGGRLTEGSIELSTPDGTLNLCSLSERQMRAVRGRMISMIFQEPMTALNPLFTVGEQIAEVIRLHLRRSRPDAERDAIALLDRVGIPSAWQRVHSYPYEFSGGMRQRVGIAMALACRPLVMIADEPTTALDVTIQAQILALIRELQDERGMSVLFITHNLGVVAEIADDVAVMYAGEFVETGPTADVLTASRHPYTRGLLECMPPEIDSTSRHAERQPLYAIPGSIPSLLDVTPGCRFAARCSYRLDMCEQAPIPMETIAPGRHSRCLRWKELA